ncbi:cellulase family glycosylhydrolase [Moheibacter sediminis]|uniref:Mannan endo-1,4-beta-mannosidase n=1 Tax=Moheibacter sediminis TaxID=1434700 RepID=A0A1W2AKN3_9FLAO|nr:cellulase family glycosylhydrolase [Moheibacter sediminis]SMC61001.1 mannan endo-1,4-beta-mannosidase [Moheibacter sediminis]
MKKSLLLFMLLPLLNFAQTMYVEGKDLYTSDGQKITLRGINYPIIDEGWDTLDDPADYKFKIDEAAKTGANAIRIPWYTNGVHWMDNITPGTVDGYVNDGTLSEILRYSHEKGMIPILELHDPNLYDNNGNVIAYRITCSNNWDYFNTVVKNWWKSEAVLNLIEENKEYLIINLANEFGYAYWTNNSTQAMNIFETNYSTLIHEIRQLGVEVPIMIDAPDCGMSSTELLSISESIQDTDPEHNLIFSAHTYWYAYAPNTAAIETKLDEIAAKNVPFLLGEVASRQDVSGSCSHALDYSTILTKSCERNIGWLAWAYTQDCNARVMTTNGVFNTLTTYGEDLVYNTVYGLISGVECAAAPLSTEDVITNENSKFKIYPNPTHTEISIENFNEIEEIKIFDIKGKLVQTIKNDFQEMNISFLANGIYMIQVKDKKGNTNSSKLMKR